MDKIVFAVVGTGWRAQFFLRCAQALPEQFAVCGVVARSREKGLALQAQFHVPVYESAEALLAKQVPDYAVVSVAASAAPEITQAWVARGVPVLLETPAAPELAALLPHDAPVQVAEQYFLRPMEQARLRYLEKRTLGTVVQARISFCNDYHAVSLMRKYLGVGFANCRITAQKIIVPGYPGYERDGPHAQWALQKREQVLAVLDFGSCAGVYDFEAMQHRSFIRSQFTQLKGTQGELMNDDIRYLTAPDTFVHTRFLRCTMGEDVNIEGFGLKGIQGDGAWLYRNPFPNSRLTDDEIAVAECMARMGTYVRTGEPFYPLAEGMQDAYLSRLIAQAAASGTPVESQTQTFAEAPCAC